MRNAETITATITKIQAIAAMLSGVQGDSQQLDSALDEMLTLTNRARHLIEDNASRLAKDIFRREFKGRAKVSLSVLVETLCPSDSQGLRSSIRAGMQAGILPGINKGEHWYVTPDTLAAWFRRKNKREEKGKEMNLAA